MKAIFQGGSFLPQESCDLPDGVEVEIFVQGIPLLPPKITDPMERAKMLDVLVERMRHNPLPLDAPKFTRDELHGRG